MSEPWGKDPFQDFINNHRSNKGRGMRRQTGYNKSTPIDDQDGVNDIDDRDENDEPGDMPANRNNFPAGGYRPNPMPPGMRAPVSVPGHHKLVGWNKTVYDNTNPDKPVVTQHRGYRKPLFG